MPWGRMAASTRSGVWGRLAAGQPADETGASQLEGAIVPGRARTE